MICLRATGMLFWLIALEMLNCWKLSASVAPVIGLDWCSPLKSFVLNKILNQYLLINLKYVYS